MHKPFFLLILIGILLILPLGLRSQPVSLNDPGAVIPSDKDSLFKQYIDLGEHYWRTDKHKADSLARLGIRLARDTIINDSLLAEGYHLLGKTLIDVGDYQAGIDTLRRCLEIKERAYGKEKIRASRTYNYIGLGYLYSNDYINAQNYFTQAILVIRKNKVFVPELFDTYMNLGILNRNKGDYSKAYYHYGRAKMIIDSLGPNADSILIAQFHFNYGNLTTTNGKLKEAIRYYNIAEEIFLKKFGPNYDWLAFIYTSMGDNEKFNENYQQAILYYQKALDINLLHKRTKTGIPESYQRLGETYLMLYDYNNAIEFCRKGLEFDPVINTKMSLYYNIARSFAKLKNLQKADQFFSLALNAMSDDQVHTIMKIIALRTYADFLYENRQFERSNKYYELGLNVAYEQYGENSESYSVILARLGYYYLEYIEDLGKALGYFEQSCSIWNKFFLVEGDDISSLIPNEIDFVDAYRGKAKTLYQFYTKTGDPKYLEESLKFYQIVLNRAELVNKNLDKENNYLLLEKINPVYNEAIQVAYERFSMKKDEEAFRAAFELSEMNKASVLLNSIQNNYALRTAEVPVEIVRMEFQLRNEINSLKKLRAEEERNSQGASPKMKFYNSRLLDLMVSHDSLKERIGQDYPRYYQLKFDRRVISLDSLRSRLSGEEAILEFSLTDSALFIFLITHDTTDLIRTGIGTRFYSALDNLIGVKDLDFGNFGEEDRQAFIRDAGFLWEKMIQPCYPDITEKHLIIVPDGLLGYLPFEILLRQEAVREDMAFNQLPYLVREFPVSYAHSSTLKYNSFFGERNPEKGLLSFSPSYKIIGKPVVSRGYQLDELPYSEQEARELRKIFGGKVYRDHKATKNRFLTESEDYHLIHLAMHALINDSLPMFSELIFTPGAQDTSSNILYTYELFGLQLGADLVTLSACNTGSGKLQKGEGIMSLARGFIYAGVPAVVMTLWEVQDKSGYEIMSSFYRHLKAGKAKDVALQQAKVDFLEQANMLKSHPYFWSSYIISGDSSKMQMPPDAREWPTNLAIALAIILLLLMGFLGLKKRRNRRAVPAP